MAPSTATKWTDSVVARWLGAPTLGGTMLVRSRRTGPPSRRTPLAEVVRRNMRRLPCRADSALSALEMNGVGEEPMQEYRRRLTRFEDDCVDQALTLHNDDAVDCALLRYLDHLFERRCPLDTGTKLMAAPPLRFPHLHRPGWGGHLPRARRTLQGWARLEPLATRLPLPWPVLRAILAVLTWWQQHDVALATLVAAGAYLRPGEALGPAKGHVTSLLMFPRAEGTSSTTALF